MQPRSNSRMFKLMERGGFGWLENNNVKKAHFDWLVENFLPKKSLVMLYGQAGSGKSYFALYLAKFLLEKSDDKISNIFYFDGDNSDMVLKQRRIEEFLELPKFHYCLANNPNKYNLFKIMLKAGDDLKDAVIIVDSIRNFIKDDFCKDNHMVKFFDDLQRIRDKGATIIFLHHQPKQMQEENNKIYKGSTSFLDSVDEGYFLHKKDIGENEFAILLEPQKKRFDTKHCAFRMNLSALSIEMDDYLKFGESYKAQITLDMVEDILNEHNGEISQQELATQIKKRAEADYVEIVGRNALWKLLEKYKGKKWDILWQQAKQGYGKKKCFKSIRK